ncbi:Cytochrome b5, partial [Colletotrichum sp. SAR11_240]
PQSNPHARPLPARLGAHLRPQRRPAQPAPLHALPQSHPLHAQEDDRPQGQGRLDGPRRPCLQHHPLPALPPRRRARATPRRRTRRHEAVRGDPPLGQLRDYAFGVFGRAAGGRGRRRKAERHGRDGL